MDEFEAREILRQHRFERGPDDSRSALEIVTEYRLVHEAIPEVFSDVGGVALPETVQTETSGL